MFRNNKGKQNKSIGSVLRGAHGAHGALALFAWFACVGGVGAEEQADDEARSDPEEIVVTGTRLRDAISGVPIVVVTRQDMLLRGLGSVEDLVRSLPQNFSDVNAAATLDNSMNSVDAIGQSGVDLRNLGEGSTLVLVNGRRWVQSSSFGDGTVNLNGIPFNAIDRVEVLTGGASAIYGADAQAGVINFILRDDFSGAETSLRQDIGANEGDILKIEQTAGVSWDGGTLLASLGYERKDPADRRKAGLTTSDFRSRGGTDGRSTFFTQPGNVSYGFPGAYFPVTPLGALPAGDDGTQGVAGRLSAANVVPLDLPALEGGLNGGTASSDSLTGYLSARQQFRDGKLTVFGELAYAKSESETTGTPLSGEYTVPATNPYNDLPPRPPLVVNVGYIFAAETAAGLMPPRSDEGSQTNLTLTAGVRAALPFADWEAEFSLSHAENDDYFGVVAGNDDLLRQRIAGVDASGNPLPREQIINLFGDGSAQSPAAVSGIIELLTDAGPASASTNTSVQRDYLASASGRLFDLPGGVSQLAVGGELRIEMLDYSADQSRGTLFVFTKPERTAKSVFAEWSLPLVSKRNEMPGLRELSVKMALRYDDYAFEGPFDGTDAPWREQNFSNTSPKLDAVWRPLESFKVRASWGESFVPPQTYRLFGSDSGPFNYIRVIDPENPDVGSQFPDAYFTGNPDLLPEVSRNVSAGFDWTPDGFLDGFGLQMTLTDIDIRNRIDSITDIVYSTPEQLFDLPGVIERGPDGAITRLNIKPLNIAALQSRFVDAAASYAFTNAVGAFKVGVEGTYTDHLREVAVPGADPTYQHGTAGGPERLKAKAFVDLQREALGLRLQANYSAGYENTTSRAQVMVDSYTTVDLTGSYAFGESGWRLNAGARNLLNADFPFYDGFGTPWDPRRVDLRGRIVHLQVTKAYGIGSR